MSSSVSSPPLSVYVTEKYFAHRRVIVAAAFFFYTFCSAVDGGGKKEYNGVMKHSSARRTANAASIAGMALNFLLAAAKIAAGFITGLVSVVADGVNNLSDCGSGAVSLVSFRIAEKPADKEHPYGHRRAEYIASMIIAFLVLLLAAELLRESAETLIAFRLPQASWWLYCILGVSVAVKGGMYFGYRIAAKRTDSDVLRAAATDSSCDCAATLAVVAGMLVSQFASFPADGVAGIAVSLFIVWQGVSILRDAGSKLLGGAPDPALVEKLRLLLLSGEGVLGVHDIKVYGYGKGITFATAHAEMDASTPAGASHEVIDGLERRAQAETGVQLTVHLDPVVLDDAEAKELEERLRAALEGAADGMNIHDFRLVRGKGKKAIFEIGVPFDCPAKDGDIRSDAERAVRLLGDYEPVVTVERE